RAVYVSGDICQALRIDFVHLLLHLRLAVLELDCGERALEVTAVALAHKARLSNASGERSDRGLVIGEFGCSHQVVLSTQFIRKMMEHQHTSAQAVGANFKARPVT